MCQVYLILRAEGWGLGAAGSGTVIAKKTPKLRGRERGVIPEVCFNVP